MTYQQYADHLLNKLKVKEADLYSKKTHLKDDRGYIDYNHMNQIIILKKQVADLKDEYTTFKKLINSGKINLNDEIDPNFNLNMLVE